MHLIKPSISTFRAKAAKITIYRKWFWRRYWWIKVDWLTGGSNKYQLAEEDVGEIIKELDEIIDKSNSFN
jgi:hypothetical protein